MVPELILKEEKINIISLENINGINIGLNLYLIEENMDYRNVGMTRVNKKNVYPDLILNGYYLIVIKSDGDEKFRAIDEQRLLGKVMQIFYDNPVLKGSKLKGFDEDIELKISLLNLSYEEISRIWSIPNRPYQLSIAYKVSNIPIKSSRSKDVKLVTSKEVKVDNKR